MDVYIKKWLIKANNNLKVALHELEMDAHQIVTEAICFHAQQSAENFFKAFLIFHETEFGKTHNLEYLLELCAKIDKDFRKLETGNLSYYAVEIRYPDDFYIPTREEADQSIQLAEAIKKFVLTKLKINEHKLS
ncbi:HEPN domain-containing protein [bacterium]|nr:HEPN domain-containing protein [bacterium]MBU1651146.1 HEPN domain-containing protein [bacterium]MBU1881544.1 HEPN domain-containing protein [bacterium]